jgi:glucose-1-phosphatase
MPAPALVLFDLDDVLARYDHAARVAVLARRVGVTDAAVQSALFDSGLEHASDIGLVSPDEHAAELTRRLAVPVKLGDCIAARGAAMRIDGRVLRIAETLADAARVAILTNNGVFVRDHLATMCPPLFPLFAGRVFCSGQFGVTKPDPNIFRRCLAALEAAPDTTLFIDDKAANADGARRAGLAAIHFTGADALLRDLAAHGFDKEPTDAL